MFQETRISTEPELNITAISDKQLAEQLHGKLFNLQYVLVFTKR